MSSDLDALRPLFCPRSIAVVGASSGPKAGGAMVRSLLGFPGDLHFVNRRGGEVDGRAAAISVEAVGAPVDLAVLVVPAEGIPATLEDCGRAGVRAAVICASGFAEAGDGRSLQDESLGIARRHGIRLLGPNTVGFVNPVDGVRANFVTGVRALQPGTASIVSSSGGVSLAAAFLAAEDGLGLRLTVGLGNAADVGFADVLGFLGADEATTVIGLHLEGVDDGRALFDAVAAVTPHKPVVALKVGRSDLGEQAASHTGRLMGDFELTRAALRQAGAVVVDDLTELVDAVRVLSTARLAPMPDPGVGIVTAQGGSGLLITDALRSRGVSIPELSEPTRKELDTLLPPRTFLRNPVDTARPIDTFADVVAAVVADESVDALLLYALEETDAVDPEGALRPVVGEVPIVFGTAGPGEAVDRRQAAMAALGVPLYRTPERVAHAMWALVEDARVRRIVSARVVPASLTLPDGALDEDAAKSLLAALGVATPARRACSSRAEAHDALAELGGPVVVKVLDASVHHKIAVGGVHLDVVDAASMNRALDAIGGACWLVEQQVGPGEELLVGGVRDACFGPVIAVGRGGSGVESNGPPAMRLAPLSRQDLDELAPDPALAAVVKAVEALLLVEDVLEIDVNPVRLTPTGPVALDALIVRRGT